MLLYQSTLFGVAVHQQTAHRAGAWDSTTASALIVRHRVDTNKRIFAVHVAEDIVASIILYYIHTKCSALGGKRRGHRQPARASFDAVYRNIASNATSMQ